MKRLLALAVLVFTSVVHAESPPIGKTTPLFDGKTLAGWEGDAKLWRVEDGCITGGSLTEAVPRNEFLASVKDYGNFIVRFKIKLTGSEGFVNSGFQIRSQRVPNNSEMAGYQCDYGEPSWYGAIYDESRRNKLMAPSDMAALRPVLKLNDWNEYIIRADGRRIQTWINGVQGVDYTEADPAIVQTGKIGIQVHGGGKALVQVKDITIEELPPTEKVIGAPEPPKAAKASPLSPEEEKAAFTLPPGFEIELVASEDIANGIGKFVPLAFDQHGALWTTTALEYPVDGNENPAAADALYASKAKDKVLIFDRDPKSPTGLASKPRVFAEGLAIPLGVLPYKNGCYVQHGHDIAFLEDTDGDGKADKRTVILTGFGVQDSHLFPHQFMRAPGGWIWMAQGAFNYGKVAQPGHEKDAVQFDQTRMAKFRPDGSGFDITSNGPCNIWGLVLNGEGEAFIQEANDFGYPVMPFHEYANYPGCSDRQWKSYAPEFPGTPGIPMGGTGLSGLALTDKWTGESTTASNKPKTQTSGVAPSTAGSVNISSLTTGRVAPSTFPEQWCDTMLIANPITRRINAIKMHRDGPRWALEKLPDFVASSDEWFRPVAITIGPDGCLYIVDWYNKIISHNEVPRNHPERDKTRGRIWRVKATAQQPFDVPDFTKATGDELLAKLGGPSLAQSHLAWQALADGKDKGVAMKLRGIVEDKGASAARRIQALWALVGLNEASVELETSLLLDPNRNMRREALRLAEPATTWPWGESTKEFARMSEDTDPEVRAEFIRWVAISSALESADGGIGISLLLSVARPPLAEPLAPSTQKGKPIKVREAYDREFERYLVRMFLEKHPDAVAKFLDSDAAKSLPIENRLLATLALEPKASAARVAQLLPKLTRAPGQEEVLRLAQFPGEPGVGEALRAVLSNPQTRVAALDALLATRTRLDAAKLTPFLADAATALLASKDPASLDLGVKLAAGFKLPTAEPALVALVQSGATQPALAGLRALTELGSGQAELFAKLATTAPDAAVRDEALTALAASRAADAPARVLAIFPKLTASQRRGVLGRLAASKAGAQAIVAALKSGALAKTELDGPAVDKLQAVLPGDADLAALMQDIGALFRPVLALNGSEEAWTQTGVTLDGPCTIETWLLLSPQGRKIGNADSILGAPGQIDINFYDGKFRVYGFAAGDVAIAKKPVMPGLWTHVAATRDAAGIWKLYLDGELDATGTKPAPQKIENARIAWNSAPGGTAGMFAEYRLWNRERTADEIRAASDRSLPANTAGLVFTSAAGDWTKLQAGAKITKTSDFPPILDANEAAALDAKYAKNRALANQPGDAARGKVAAALCQACHLMGPAGGNIGPNLSGVGAMGTEGILRNILQPNAAMENGYRIYRVELKNGDLVDALFVSEDKDAVVVRAPGTEDRRIPKAEIRDTKYLRRSLMPEGLLDAYTPEQVSDLFAYLKTLK